MEEPKYIFSGPQQKKVPISQQAGGRIFQTAGKESVKFQRQERARPSGVDMVEARIRVGCLHDYRRTELIL